MSLITRPMLAPREHPEGGISFPVLATPKLDGIRCLRVNGDTLSRTFKPIPNRHIQEMMSVLPNGLDGELMVEGATFNQIQGDVMREEGKPNFRYYVFDYVSTSLTETYADRMKKLEALELPSFCVKVLPKLIKSKDELDEYEQECLGLGYEGLMVRAPHGHYKCGRATARQQWLLKVKQFVDSEVEIVGFEEMMRNENEAEKDAFGKTKRSSHKDNLVPAGTLGTLIVKELGDFPWKGKTFGIGTGFDAAMRKEIWDNRDKYLGKIGTYKFQPHGVKDLPRIPVWKGLRHKEDISE